MRDNCLLKKKNNDELLWLLGYGWLGGWEPSCLRESPLTLLTADISVLRILIVGLIRDVIQEEHILRQEWTIHACLTAEYFTCPNDDHGASWSQYTIDLCWFLDFSATAITMELSQHQLTTSACLLCCCFRIYPLFDHLFQSAHRWNCSHCPRIMSFHDRLHFFVGAHCSFAWVSLSTSFGRVSMSKDAKRWFIYAQ